MKQSPSWLHRLRAHIMPAYILTILLLQLISSLFVSRISAEVRICVPEHNELQIYENATVGSAVVADIREYLQISPDRQVRLGPGALSSFFTLSPNNTLLVKRSLDLEGSDLCQADRSCCQSGHSSRDEAFLSSNYLTPACRIGSVVLANSGGQTPLKLYCKINALILDINDHTPEFFLPRKEAFPAVPRIYIPFSEGFKGVGERFQLPTAKDRDFLPENSMVTYSIAMTKPDEGRYGGGHAKQEIPASSGSPAWAAVGPFRLVFDPKEDTLALVVSQELDRETQPEYELVLTAEDGSGQTAVLNLQVHLLDVNEFAPVFTGVTPLSIAHVTESIENSNRVVNLYENMTTQVPFLQVLAEDKDAPPANRIAYKFAQSFQLSEAASIFTIDSTSGIISLEKPLDYERVKRYVIPVLAIDASYEPDFTGDDSLTPSARKVAQAIAESIRKELKTAELTLDIRVLDCNDHAPEIKLQGDVSDAGEGAITGIAELSVLENAHAGASLVFFSAVDRDQGEAGVTQCRLLNWTEKFRIHNYSDFFSLEISGDLDREARSEYLITIECFDHGNPRQFSQKRIRVTLLDVNDEQPAFHHPLYTFHVLENSNPGNKLIPVGDSYTNPIQAFDKDINSTLTYHLEPSNAIEVDQSSAFDYQLFEVEPSTGILRTKSSLDREQRSNHRFTFCAEDGLHKACTAIIVHVDDVNDNPPVFDHETYIVRLVENSQQFEPLIIFHVEDVDIGNQGFTFSIEAPQSSTKNDTDQPNLHKFFNIRDNKLFLRHPLDREAQSHYHFFVRVSDSQKPTSPSHPEGLSCTAEVFIEVADTNDNAPVFVFPNATSANEGGNQLNVSCRETMGSSVGRVEAVDLDLGPNGTVVYSIIRGPASNELFYLDKQSGELFVNSGTLSENCDAVFLLVVSVDDMGPANSKKGRPLPVERLLIRLQDQPTLAESMSLNSQHASRANVRDAARGDSGYLGLPAKTMLSVVLGGCIVFLTGLFLAWIILMLVSRSKRRRMERTADPQYPAAAGQRFDISTLPMSTKQEIFIHPAGTFPPGTGLQGTLPVMQYVVGVQDETFGHRDTAADDSMSSRTSPCGQSVNSSGGRHLPGLLPGPSGVNDGRRGLTSPFHSKQFAAEDAKIKGQIWRKNNSSPGDTALVAEQRDAGRPSSSASSGESTRYLLFPGLPVSTAASVGLPTTSFADKTTRSALKQPKYTESSDCDPSLQPRCDLHRRSQYIPEEYHPPEPYQNNTISKARRPFFTPPPTRKFIQSPEDGSILENVHFMFADSDYTSLLKSPGSAQARAMPGTCENQYLIITGNGPHDVSSTYNTIGRCIPRGSSLPRNIRQCSRSPEAEQLLFKRLDDENGDVILVPTSSAPLSFNNTIPPIINQGATSRRSSHQEESTIPLSTTTPFQPDYISLEDLLNSCV